MKDENVCRRLMTAMVEMERAGVPLSIQKQLASQVLLTLGRPALGSPKAIAMDRLRYAAPGTLKEIYAEKLEDIYREMRRQLQRRGVA